MSSGRSAPGMFIDDSLQRDATSSCCFILFLANTARPTTFLLQPSAVALTTCAALACLPPVDAGRRLAHIPGAHHDFVLAALAQYRPDPGDSPATTGPPPCSLGRRAGDVSQLVPVRLAGLGRAARGAARLDFDMRCASLSEALSTRNGARAQRLTLRTRSRGPAQLDALARASWGIVDVSRSGAAGLVHRPAERPDAPGGVSLPEAAPVLLDAGVEGQRAAVEAQLQQLPSGTGSRAARRRRTMPTGAGQAHPQLTLTLAHLT